MKPKLSLQIPAVGLILIASLTVATAQPMPQKAPTGLPAGAASPAVYPTTGLPAPVAIDPTTGLPMAQPEPQWIDSDWHDPNIMLTNVMYDGLPLSEVANDLREKFKNHFDILPMPMTFNTDWGANIPIRLQMKNVTASDLFNAMNLVFENDRTPVRWHLMTRSGARQLVQLCVLPEAAPELPAAPPETHRMVYFIGDLIGNEKSGGLSVEQIDKIIGDTWPEAYGKREGVVQFHSEAQLLIVNGTREQLQFIQQILGALKQKAEYDRAKQMPAGADPQFENLKKLMSLMQESGKSGTAPQIDNLKKDLKSGSNGGNNGPTP